MIWDAILLPLLPGPLWPRVVVPVRALSMSQIELFNHLLYCSEIERQTGICRSKRPWVICCRLCEFSNHTRLDKIKQVVNRVNKRWNVTTKLCDLNSFRSNTKRKKQEVTSKMAYLEVQKWRKSILCVEYRKYRKTEAWASLGVRFVGHTSRL